MVIAEDEFPRRRDEQRTETCRVQADGLQGGPEMTAMTEELRGKPRECSVLSQDLRKVHGIGLRIIDYWLPLCNNSVVILMHQVIMSSNLIIT